MKAIVAVDLNWAIGCNGCLLERIPEDMEFFKDATSGKVVVMGRETFESLPGKKPLKGRTNIVLSSNTEYENNGILICHSLSELFLDILKFNSDDVFVIGGESVYKQLLPYCTEVLVTKIYNTYAADRFFPDLDKENDWTIASSSEVKTYNSTCYKFIKYIKKNSQVLFK